MTQEEISNLSDEELEVSLAKALEAKTQAELRYSFIWSIHSDRKEKRWVEAPPHEKWHRYIVKAFEAFQGHPFYPPMKDDVSKEWPTYATAEWYDSKPSRIQKCVGEALEYLFGDMDSRRFTSEFEDKLMYKQIMFIVACALPELGPYTATIWEWGISLESKNRFFEAVTLCKSLLIQSLHGPST